MYPEIHIFFFQPSNLFGFNSLLFCCLLVLVENEVAAYLSTKIALNLSLSMMLFDYWELAHTCSGGISIPLLESPMELFRLWEGGYVFYGGAIAAFLSLFFIFELLSKIGEFGSIFSPVHSFRIRIRTNCLFLAGCCYGKSCDLPWAIHLVFRKVLTPLGRHPTQIYASVWDLLLWHYLAF